MQAFLIYIPMKVEKNQDQPNDKQVAAPETQLSERDKATNSDLDAVSRLSSFLETNSDETEEMERVTEKLVIRDDEVFSAWEQGIKPEKKEEEGDESEDEDSQDSDAEDADKVDGDGDGKDEDKDDNHDKEIEEEGEEEGDEQKTEPDWLNETLKDFMVEGETPQKAVETLVNRAKELEQALQEEEEANSKLIELFDANPEIKDVVRLLNKGFSLSEALVTTLEVDELISLKNDPKAQEKLTEKRIRRELEAKQAQEKTESNINASKSTLDAFYAEAGYTDDAKKEQFTKQMDSLVRPLFEGLVTPELVRVIHKGLKYDSDIQQAATKAKVEATNKKVEKEVAKRKGDGLPDASSRRDTVTTKRTVEDFLPKRLITDGEWA